MQHATVHTRLAGGLLLTSIFVMLAWRLVLVESILGPLDPSSDLPAAERDILASGLLVGSIIAASGLTVLARQLSSKWAAVGQYACQAAPVILVAGMLGLLFNPSFQLLFSVFAGLMTCAWVLLGVALWQTGVLRWVGAVTAVLGTAAFGLVMAGAFIIFIMFTAVLPLAIGLVVPQQAHTQTGGAQRESSWGDSRA